MGLGAVPVGGGRPATGDLDGTTAKQNSPPGTVPVQFGIKLAQHEAHIPTSGTKLSLLARNGPFWRVLHAYGELSTVFVSKQPRRANSVPHARQRRG